jgi:polysaccharide export outer membrane protein
MTNKWHDWLRMAGAAAIASAAAIALCYAVLNRGAESRDCNSCSDGGQATSSTKTDAAVLPADIRLCQALGPAAPHAIWGVDSTAARCGEVGWDARGMIPWQEFAQGEYVGHARTPHVAEYRLREGDAIAIYFLRTREEFTRPYELQVGDRIRVESLTAGQEATAATPTGAEPQMAGDDIARELVVQPDGTITLPLVGQVRATRRSIQSLRDELEQRFAEWIVIPSITVTPITVNTKLEDLMDTIDSRAGTLGGRQLQVTITPAGDIQLPAIDNVFVQGLTLAEAKQEIDARYNATIPGVETSLILVQRAKRFIYVVGEVRQAGRFELTGPTTAMGSLALAGGWNDGANLRQVVVFRRGPDWRLMATMLDLRGALYGRRPTPADEIWLNDSDIVLVTKTPIEQADELIDQLFTRGLYSVVPREVLWNINVGTSL